MKMYCKALVNVFKDSINLTTNVVEFIPAKILVNISINSFELLLDVDKWLVFKGDDILVINISKYIPKTKFIQIQKR